MVPTEFPTSLPANTVDNSALSAVFLLILDNRAFQNPRLASINSLLERCNTDLSQIDEADCSATHRTDLTNALDLLVTALTNLRDSTNWLSGVTLTGNPNLPALLSVGYSYCLLRQTLNPGKDISPYFTALFSPLLDYSDLVAGTEQLGTLVERINGSPDPDTKAVALKDTILTISNRIEASVEQVVSTYDSYVAYLSKYALANTLVGLPTSGNTLGWHLVSQYVGSQELIEKLSSD